MKKFSTKLLNLSLICSLMIAQLSCSPSSYTSQEGMMGGITGTTIGAGIGWWFGKEYGKMTENILLNSAIGGGIGLLAGALLHDQNIKIARKREIVKRESIMISQNQKELDMLRERLYDSTSWGGNETKSWDERYVGEDSDYPYQGAISPRQ